MHRHDSDHYDVHSTTRDADCGRNFGGGGGSPRLRLLVAILLAGAACGDGPPTAPAPASDAYETALGPGGGSGGTLAPTGLLAAQTACAPDAGLVAKAQANYERRKAAVPENDWKRWLATVKVRDDAEPFTVEELEARVQVWAGWQEFLDEVRRLMECGFFNEEEAPPPQDPPPSDPQPTCEPDADLVAKAQANYEQRKAANPENDWKRWLATVKVRDDAEPFTVAELEGRVQIWAGWQEFLDEVRRLGECGFFNEEAVVVVEPEPETPPMAQGEDFCPQKQSTLSTNPNGTITMRGTGGWPGSVNERTAMSGSIEIKVDICNIGRPTEDEISLSDYGVGICVDHLKIDGWTRKDRSGQPVRWCGQIAAGDVVNTGWTVEGNKSGKADVYAVGAKGRITFRGMVRAYDDGVVRGDRTTRRSSLRAYLNRFVGGEDGGHAAGVYEFVNNLPDMTVREQDAATVSLERRFVYGGRHHGWNYVVDVDKPIVTGRSGDTSTPEYWTMAITAGGKGFWVRVPSGRIFSGTTHDALPLASLRANMGGTVRTMKEWCGRSESERGNMQYESVKVQGIAGPDPSQISFSELAAGTDLCNP